MSSNSEQRDESAAGSESRRSHHHHHDPNAPRSSQKSVGHNPRIGRYEIIKTLGEGSFGKVKLARHMATHQRVALKIINRKTLAKSDMQGRVEREISYLRLLRHPHIIKLFDVIKSKEEIIMVMEFAGKELFDYIVQRGKMPEDEARRFFQQIISAIEYCHRHKIVHRDLKPENLLLDEHLNVKIGDFGLSNIMTDGDFLKTSCGSPNYAAPEVISGKLYAGPEVDVWSCGVILYVMLCGRLPFDDEFIPALFRKISSGVYSLPSYLSPGAKNLIQRLLVVNPLNRISVDEILEDEWFKVEMPEYLLPPLLKQKKLNQEIDEAAVEALESTMGYARDEVYEALIHRNDVNAEKNEIQEAYDLIVENQKFITDLKEAKTGTNMDAFLSQSPPSWSAVSSRSNLGSTQNSRAPTPSLHDNIDSRHLPFHDQDSTSNSTIAILPTSLPSYHRAYMSGNSKTLKKISPVSTKKSKTRWHFGIRSRSYPLDVMGEIYRALQNLGAEWSKPSKDDLWTIRVRWKYEPKTEPDAPPTPLSENGPQVMKMQIQLYQIEQNNYLVDFKFDGWENNDLTQPSVVKEDPTKTDKEIEDEIGAFSAYPFLHLATRLIMELAINSQS